tara:strand:+ start:1942 stop:2133 length:192 start_codon:yes stop_codon:yes gene_type:complete
MHIYNGVPKVGGFNSTGIRTRNGISRINSDQAPEHIYDDNEPSEELTLDFTHTAHVMQSFEDV